MPRIENWSVTRMSDPYKAPEQMPEVLQGNIYDRPNIPDGTYRQTNIIRGVTAEGLVRTASGTEYVLGEVDPGYEKAFPNARERFFKSAKKV